MVDIKKLEKKDKKIINEIVQIHLNTFSGFFLTFMGKGFLKQMYSSYCDHINSNIYIATSNGKILGFLSYSSDMSGLYKFMIKKRLIPFAWYAFGAFLRKPKVFFRLIRAFLKPGESKREEKYIELSSIGVNPNEESKGIGTQLIQALINDTDFNEYEYISLETDAINNEKANYFYKKNGFKMHKEYETHEGRKMNEYRYCGENC